MTHHTTIIAGRSRRLVRVERPRRRKAALGWTRLQVHQIGLAAVADELGLASLLDMGGIMTAERMHGLLRPKCGDQGNQGKTKIATKAPSCLDAAPGSLAADVSRLIRPEWQRQFGAELWLGGAL